MNNFTYLGFEFKPIKRITGNDDNFHEISKRLKGNIILENWNYGEFYNLAKKNDCGKMDLFDLNGKIVIPTTGCLFEYNL